LGIEQRLRQAAGEAQQHFEILAAGVQHLHHCVVLQHRGERAPVMHGERIDQVSAPAVADLHQPGNGIEGIDPHEFGVHRHIGQLAPLRRTGGSDVHHPEPIGFRWPHGPPFSADDRRAAERGAQYISSIRPAGGIHGRRARW